MSAVMKTLHNLVPQFNNSTIANHLRACDQKKQTTSLELIVLDSTLLSSAHIFVAALLLFVRYITGIPTVYYEKFSSHHYSQRQYVH